MPKPTKPRTTGEIVKSKGAKEIVGNGPTRTHIMPNGSGGGLVQKGRQGFISTFTEDKAEEIVAKTKKGLPYTFAAQSCRVPQATASRWLAKGEEDCEAGLDTEMARFAADIREAQAAFVEKAIDGIVDAGLDDAKQWTALMTLLERIYPEYFKRPMDKPGSNVTVNVGVGLVERKLHELHAAGEIVYDGG